MKTKYYLWTSLFFFACTLSAVGPGVSNRPYYLFIAVPYLLITYFFKSDRSKRLRTDTIFSFLLLFAILSLISSLVGSYPTLAVENILWSFSILVAYLFLAHFDLIALLSGVIIGFLPVCIFIFFFELPLRILFPSFFDFIRTSLGLRTSYGSTFIGFFMEPSQIPAGFLLLLLSVLLFVNRDRFASLRTVNLFPLKHIVLFESFILLTHLSGTWLTVLILPLSLILSLWGVYTILVFYKAPRIPTRLPLLTLAISLLIFLLAFSFGLPYLLQKFTYSMSFDHSFSSRFLSLITGIWDALSNYMLPRIGSDFRATRLDSAVQLQSIFQSFPSIAGSIDRMLSNSNMLRPTFSGFVPVYSLISWFFYELGFLTILFIYPFLKIFMLAVKHMFKFPITTPGLCYISILSISMSYLICMCVAYPRILPYQLAAILLFDKTFFSRPPASLSFSS